MRRKSLNKLFQILTRRYTNVMKGCAILMLPHRITKQYLHLDTGKKSFNRQTSCILLETLEGLGRALRNFLTINSIRKSVKNREISQSQ